MVRIRNRDGWLDCDSTAYNSVVTETKQLVYPCLTASFLVSSFGLDPKGQRAPLAQTLETRQCGPTCKPAFPLTMPNAHQRTTNCIRLYKYLPLYSYGNGNSSNHLTKIPKSSGIRSYPLSHVLAGIGSHKDQLVPSEAAPEGPADPPGCSADPCTGEIWQSPSIGATLPMIKWVIYKTWTMI